MEAELRHNKHTAAPNKDLLLCLPCRSPTISVTSLSHTHTHTPAGIFILTHRVAMSIEPYRWTLEPCWTPLFVCIHYVLLWIIFIICYDKYRCKQRLRGQALFSPKNRYTIFDGKASSHCWNISTKRFSTLIMYQCIIMQILGYRIKNSFKKHWMDGKTRCE